MVTVENVEGITITRNFSFFKNVPDFKTSTVAAKWYARETLPQRAESAQPSLLTMFWNYSELFYKDIFCYSIPYSVRFTFGDVHILRLIHSCLPSVCGILSKVERDVVSFALCRLGILDERARGCQIGVVSMENKRRLSLIRTP